MRMLVLGRPGTPCPPVSLLLLIGLLWACGGSDAGEADMRVDEGSAMDTTPAGTPAPPSLPAIAHDVRRQTTVTLTEWRVTPGDELLPGGEITFQVANAGSEPHTLAVEGQGVSERSESIAAGGTASLTVGLEPGTYRLFCPDVAGGEAHADRGMSAPFVVR